MNKRTQRESSMDELTTLFNKKTRMVPAKQLLLPYASEAAKNFALKQNINPNSVKGTGSKGTITKKDLQDYLTNKDKRVVEAMETVKEVAVKNALPEPDMRKLMRAIEGLSLEEKKVWKKRK